MQSYVHHRIPQSMSFSIVQTSYLNNPQCRVMYTITFLKVRAFQLSKRHISTIHNVELCTTITFLKVRAFQLSKRHISTIHNVELCTPSHSSKYELFNCPNVISQQSTMQSYVHHHIPQSTSFSIVQTSYLNNPQCRVMYTITFLKVRAFQLSKRHISTIHNVELCTPSHSSKYELFNCPNVISQQSTIQSYVHHHIPQSTSFSIVQTSYLNNSQFRVMYTITFLKVRAFQVSKRHISTCKITRMVALSVSIISVYLIWYVYFLNKTVFELMSDIMSWRMTGEREREREGGGGGLVGVRKSFTLRYTRQNKQATFWLLISIFKQFLQVTFRSYDFRCFSFYIVGVTLTMLCLKNYRFLLMFSDISMQYVSKHCRECS